MSASDDRAQELLLCVERNPTGRGHLEDTGQVRR
jgi:hypothetical protein